MSIFAERKCNFSPVSTEVYTALIHHFTCRFEARQALIYQLVLGLTGENGKYNYSRAVHVYPPFFDITCSAKTFKIASALTDATGGCYLTENQRKLIALLLLAEIRSKITAGTIDLTAPASYIPDIFADKDLHRHVRDFLLKKDASFTAPIANKIAQMQISSSVIPTVSKDKGAEILTTYHLADTLTYLLLDLQKYVSSSRRLKECQCCGRLFYPQFRQSEKYCRLPRKDTPFLCNKIMHISPNDEFAKAREGARKYQHSRTNNESTKKKYDEKFLSKLYENWSRECAKKCIKFKREDDLHGFKIWIESTKFLAKELKRLWEEYQANGSIPYGGSADGECSAGPSGPAGR